MKSGLLLPVCLLLSACALFHRDSRPAHAPPEEAARVQFPLDLPEDARTLEGGTVTAMQLALDDFRPLDLKPHKGATEEEQCLYQRESYDVTAAPGPEGVTFVQITLKPQLCEKQGPLMDMGATYAVDVKGRRILAIQH
ncbi:hypothetical protein D7Y13_07430 [Corallococcus praedator]|uniref:Lipoprotein n=1 Tax=Corallococcus praedator TaxID=2316724 RepID=A0ABX9QNB4_9BACT|nr:MULTISPECIES: hypothetical protein [Corallococcus]RKH18461.1 hypothetical protein D7X74_09510 [Corallococcus sp. CA047B]RKH32991.1 hypothetical protein D7X75_13710 [Corallococcus sp. CA031C]RKI13535.1 hypothetical protein D7Y13_07430 [Corallococcus praedator]